MKRLVELIKTILIVLLICSLALLAVATVPTHTLRESPWLSTMLKPIAPLLGMPEAELAYVAAAPTISDAAQPVAISVRNSAGRNTAFRDFYALDDRFDTLGSFLGQALDTAEIFTKVTQSQLETALSANGVYFRYSAPLPAALLASWLGASLEAAVPEVEACLLSTNDETVVLYLIGPTNYMAPTPLASAELLALLETYRPDGSRFAFEGGYTLSPLDLIAGGAVAVPGATVTNPVTSRFVEQLATDLHFNPYGESRYTDTDGAIHFSEANCNLEIAPGGQIHLTSTADGRFSAPAPDQASLVETARQLTALATGGYLGSGRLYLTGVTQQDGETVCTFDYFFSGIPVVLDSGSAATVVFSGQAVTELTVRPYSFFSAGQTLYPLPVAQASALLPKGESLVLQYRLTADGTLDAGWKE